MTLAEQREKLIELMNKTYIGAWYKADVNGLPWTNEEAMGGVLDAISAARFSIVGPEVTLDMLDAAQRHFRKHGYAEEIFKAMLAAGDLARKP